MKQSEAVLAIRYLAAYFPNQRLDEFTADAWAEALARYEYLDAKDAIRTIATRPLRQGQSFLLELRDVTGEIDTIVDRRIRGREHLMPPPPSHLGPDAYSAWMRAQYALIRQRDWTPPGALPPGVEGGVTHGAEALDCRVAKLGATWDADR